MADTLKELVVADAAAWRCWLSREYERSPGVWLAFHKKGGGVTRLGYADALRAWPSRQPPRRREVGQPDREAHRVAGVELAEGLEAVAVSIGVHVEGPKGA
jgi:hypothetical protein